MQISEQMKIITLDINDVYVNQSIQGIIQTTKFWLNKNINDNESIKQTLYMLETIMKQNYFQYNEQLFQPEKGIAMGSPISSIMAEVYLQYIEETYPHNKKWVTFTYFSPIRRITNIFKHSNLNIAFRATNTIQQQLTEKPTNKKPSGIYKLKCNTCNNVYAGQ